MDYLILTNTKMKNRLWELLSLLPSTENQLADAIWITWEEVCLIKTWKYDPSWTSVQKTVHYLDKLWLDIIDYMKTKEYALSRYENSDYPALTKCNFYTK